MLLLTRMSSGLVRTTPFMKSNSFSTAGSGSELGNTTELAENVGLNAAEVVEKAGEDVSQIVGAAETATTLEGSGFFALLSHVLSAVHVNLNLPWWVSIAATTFAFRTAILPLAISQLRNSARLQLIRPQMTAIQEKMKEVASTTQNREEILKLRMDMLGLFKKHNCNPLKAFVMVIVQAPVFITFFGALRKMSEAIPSFHTGGIFWFTDLAVPDPTYALPAIAGLTFLATIELGSDGMSTQDPSMSKMKNVMRIMSLAMIPLTAQLPSAVFVYWITSNLFSLGQTLMLRIPGMKDRFGIPNVPASGVPAAKTPTYSSSLENQILYSQKPKKKE